MKSRLPGFAAIWIPSGPTFGTAPGSAGSREGWERVPYWLDGFIPLAYLLEDRDMIARAGRYVDAILRAQRPDGWICPCKDEERSGYDPWAILLISKVLTVCYDCSKDVRIPEVLYRLLRNAYELLQSGEIRLFNWGKFRYFEGLIAVRFLYARCGEDWLLRLAALLKAQGTDYGSLTGLWKTPLNRWRFETHIVNIAMMLKAEALECTLTGAPYTDQAEALHKILERYNGTPVGLFTGDECLSGLSPIQGTELCAVVEQMYAYEWLYACTGEDKWAERLELLAFNALPAACSDDMWAHQYVQMSNQIACEIFPGKPGVPHQRRGRAYFRAGTQLRLLHGQFRAGLAEIRPFRVPASGRYGRQRCPRAFGADRRRHPYCTGDGLSV